MRFQLPTSLVPALLASCMAAVNTAYASTAGAHAPITVMADHNHRSGEWMLSYRYSHMEMRDNQDGGSSIKPAQIATSVPNRFAPPPTLRVVPTKMSMDMHMLGAMYALNDQWTLMGMVHYMEKDMEHITYQGASGSTVLGRFRTRSRGLGDTEVQGIGELYAREHARLLLNIGLSVPTADTDAKDEVLAPTGAQPVLRLPYPMQLGSGTYDLLGGLTYTDGDGAWNWGTQWRSEVRLGENDEDYTLGDEHLLQGWASFARTHRVSYSARLAWLYRGNIDGMDPDITAPVQTADPDRQALQRLDAALGVNALLPGHQHRLAIEWVKPVYQHLDGPQLKSDWQLTVGWQYAP